MLPDPILGTSVPQLFAHRGGAGECPESTQQGFLHATVSKADVKVAYWSMDLVGRLISLPTRRRSVREAAPNRTPPRSIRKEFGFRGTPSPTTCAFWTCS